MRVDDQNDFYEAKLNLLGTAYYVFKKTNNKKEVIAKLK